MQTLIGANDLASLWGMMAVGTAVSIWLEGRYRWAARLSGPVLALLIAMALSNSRVAPMESAAYDFVGDWLVPLAIPLLLFRADIRQIIATGGRLLFLFHIAAVGTLLGVALAVGTLRGTIPPEDLQHAAGMMAGSYIGGGVNFMAMKTSYNVSENIAGPLIVADNFVMAGIFVALLAMAGSRWFLARYAHPHTGGEACGGLAGHWKRKEISLLDMATGLAFGFACVGIAMALGRWTRSLFGDVTGAGAGMQMLQVLATNRFVLITTVSLGMATLLARPLAKVNGPEEMGAYLLALFLFTLGLPADLVKVVVETPIFFVFCAVIALTNLAFTLAVGRVLKLNLEEILVAVNASLGGAPSAAAMATSAGWPKLIVPALLVGIWGYVIGTPLGIMTVELLRR